MSNHTRGNLDGWYTVRSERMFCEQLGYNLLFKWFLDMDMHEPAFDPTSFTKNRKRLLDYDVAGHFFRTVVEQARKAGLMSAEHFSVDGTLIEAWASMKSFRPKDDDDSDNDGWADFRGKKRSNETHESKTDPEAKLMRKGKGKEAKLSYCLSALMENRNGLLTSIDLALATGFAERTSALAMLDYSESSSRRRTVGADAGYDTSDFVAACRERGVTPHVAQNRSSRRSAIDGRTTRWEGYSVSIAIRRMIERVFGWMKTTANFRRTRLKGRARRRWQRPLSARPTTSCGSRGFYRRPRDGTAMIDAARSSSSTAIERTGYGRARARARAQMP